MFDEISQKMRTRSASLLVTLDNKLDRILFWWLIIAGSASIARIALTPHKLPMAPLSAFASYMLLVVAPFASTLLALRWFSDGDRHPQPSLRLARVGKWKSLSRDQAQAHPLYGTTGIMVSLLVGMMLNVPVRAAEYFAAMDPLPAAAPHWLSVLHFAMTLDVVLFGSLYMIAFVAALRRMPLFPRLLLVIWLADLTMQLATAQMVSATHIPAPVADAVHTLLIGNVKKVLISIGLWLPYLLLSTRVNVTFRHRIPA